MFHHHDTFFGELLQIAYNYVLLKVIIQRKLGCKSLIKSQESSSQLYSKRNLVQLPPFAEVPLKLHLFCKKLIIMLRILC